MALLRPSLTLVLDIDERLAQEETVLEIKRSYAHIGTPVIRTHAAHAGDRVCNRARCLVNMGTYKYLLSSDEGADERWRDIVEPWIANLLRRVGNNMKVFNDRQRRIKLPQLMFDRLDIELQGGQFIVGLHPDPLNLMDTELHKQVGLARELLNTGVFAAVVRVDIPSDESFEKQREHAWDAWVIDHPEALETKSEDAQENGIVAAINSECSAGLEEESEKSYEQRMQEDIEAKSYERTAVPPTDAASLPAVEREEEEEPEQFTFDVKYDLWEVVFADGTRRTFDASSRTFAE